MALVALVLREGKLAFTHLPFLTTLMQNYVYEALSVELICVIVYRIKETDNADCELQ